MARSSGYNTNLSRRQQRKLRKMKAQNPMGFGMGMGMGTYGLGGIGVLGLLGAGILGYSLLSKRSIGFSSFGRSWLPWRTTAIGGVTTGIASAPITTGISPLRAGFVQPGIATTGILPQRLSPTLKERMGFVGVKRRIGVFGLVKGLKNKVLYGTPYMFKEPVRPISNFTQVL
jgi:hypothetical protein